MGKKSSATAVSKTSSLPAQTASSSKSSILKSAFAPSRLQLRLFASIIQSFDSEQLRVHDFSTGRLRQQHSIPAGSTVTCLDWGRYGQSVREQSTPNKKKRKRNQDVQQDVVVAYGTSMSEISMYSPTEGKVIGTLKDGHKRGIKAFRFVPEDDLQAWSLGGDDKLVQWNLQTDQVVRSISLPDSAISTLSSPSLLSPQVFCASVVPYAVDIDAKESNQLIKFDAFKNPIHSMIRPEEIVKSSTNAFLASDHDRYVNIYDVSEQKISRTLVAGAGIDDLAIHYPKDKEDQVLAVITTEGVVEIFSRPFDISKQVNGDIPSKRKNLTRKANAFIKIVAPGSAKQPVAAFTACFDGPNLIVASVEGAIEPVFTKIRWQDEATGALLLAGSRAFACPKSASTLNTATANGTRNMGEAHLNDARTVVVNGLAEAGSEAVPLEIESSEEETTDDDESDDKSSQEAASDNESQASDDVEMADAALDLEGTTAGDHDGEAEPSFGELLAARNPGEISILDHLPTEENTLGNITTLSQLPSGMSLGTVLTQSLRTNDQSLLETCLHVTDENVIQNTILRLDSALAANLLTKLAERLADRPGRYGHLLTWVQSTMIAHGGAIASQAGVSSKLRTLYTVLNERSKVLPSILLLKGKLDMLSAQQSFRAQAEEYRKVNENVPARLYIEGQEDNWSSDEEMDEEIEESSRKQRKPKAIKDLEELVGDAESSEDEGMPLINGHTNSDDDEDDVSDEEDTQRLRLNGIVDDEADVSGEDEEDAEGSEDDGSEEEDDEDDSSLDSFINDGEISEGEEDDIDIAEEQIRPAKKKSKHR